MIKHDQEIFFLVQAGAREELYHWKNDAFGRIESGRIGPRQMWGKKSLYRNFRVFVTERPDRP